MVLTALTVSTEKAQQILFSHNVATKCDHSRATSRKLRVSSWNGMGCIQRVKGDQATLGINATTVFSKELNEVGKSNRIHVVFDTYCEDSIENNEKLLKGEQSGHQLQDITVIVRPWRHSLTRVKNKNSLISFIVREWMKASFREKLQQKFLYPTISDKC